MSRSRVDTMASVRAVLLLLPAPLSVVVVVMAARWLYRVTARNLTALARSQLACLPSGSGGPTSSSSFRPYLLVDDVAKQGRVGGELPPVALYYSRRRSSCTTTTTRRLPEHGGEERREEEEEPQQKEECVFCLSVIEEGSEVRELRCRHLFHRACLDRWLRARPAAPTCPLCRARLLPSSPPPWDLPAGYYYYADDDDDDGEEEEAVQVDSDSDSDSDMMLFMACVHGRSSWLWPP